VSAQQIPQREIRSFNRRNARHHNGANYDMVNGVDNEDCPFYGRLTTLNKGPSPVVVFTNLVRPGVTQIPSMGKTFDASVDGASEIMFVGIIVFFSSSMYFPIFSRCCVLFCAFS
jgi:hypothetical protein